MSTRCEPPTIQPVPRGNNPGPELDRLERALLRPVEAKTGAQRRRAARAETNPLILLLARLTVAIDERERAAESAEAGEVG